MMKAILIREFGDAGQLYIGDAKKPVVGPGQLLVKIYAAGINRADTFQRQGKYPPPAGASEILGLEMAGIVEDTGPETSRFQKGDHVFGLIPGGGYAQYAAIHEEMAMPVPENMSMTHAAAIPEAFLTAFQALRWHGNIQVEEDVLIHAGGSGVGTAAIQLAQAIGAKSIVTASAPKHEVCLKLGTKKAIDYKNEDFKTAVLEYTDQKGVDLIIDFIGGPYFKDNIDCLNRDGRLVILATLGGGNVENFDVRKMLVNRLNIIGSTLRSRSIDYQIALTHEFREFALQRFTNSNLKPVVDKIFNWEDVKDAHEYMEANKNTGKIILEVKHL
ncbi:MAG: NAD(P)H-quinone oxidoreductase [Bacteroidales bacterium]|nr:NAD(P)H-quinone oxidoreductase [Bacteroidales bacterium]